MSEPVFIIGIDLGTTNSVVAYTRIQTDQNEKTDIHIFEVPQYTGAGVIERRESLPSFIYMPDENKTEGQNQEDPWGTDNNYIIGEYARERGAEIPQRLVASAKSWLCNTMIDRNKPVLPWGSPENVSRISPVDASACILKHIRSTWNHTIAINDAELRFENQDIFLTVPASFDALARDLTVKAAEIAGIDNLTLLEEPQAAFYSWIESSGDQWRQNVKKGDLILICDIGGGTSDFSLIQVSENEGELVLERVAVGDHLLVGGDNMDLAMAYSVAQNLSKSNKRLDQWQMRMLIHNSRTTKEKILSNAGATDEYPVTVLGRGSSLIGGTIKATVSRAEIERLIVDGFFPKCDFVSTPKQSQKVGLKETGLSYEDDPAVTRHLANFLHRYTQKINNTESLPNSVLFNGGVMKSPTIRNRIMESIDSWNSENSQNLIHELHSDDYDLSVARGAAYYGMARRGQGVRIRGGLGKSYYIGIAASMPAVPGMSTPIKALCVAPFGMEEGTEVNLKSSEFILVVGEPVRFDFLRSSVRNDDGIGDIVEDWEDQLDEITTLETILDGNPGEIIRVTLEIKITEIGTLELRCVSAEGKKWKLEFNVREKD